MNNYDKIQPSGGTGELEISQFFDLDRYVTLQSESPSISASYSSLDYGKVLNRSEDIFQGESSIDSFTVAPQVKQTALLILAELKDQISDSTDLQISRGKLPSLMITQAEDCIIIEWPFKDVRMCFNIGVSITSSYWFIVTNKKFQDANFSDDLNNDKLPAIVTAFLDIAKALV